MDVKTKKPRNDGGALPGDSSLRGSAIKHGERIASYSECKKRSAQMMRHISDEPMYTTEHEAMTQCANYLVFNNYYTADEIRLAKIRTCKKHMLCPLCAKLRAVKQSVAYVEKFQHVMAENPTLKPVMLTLTVKNGKYLSERFRHLKNSFKKVQESIRDWRKKGRGYNEYCKIEGMAYSYEFTKNPKTGEWHPHIHAVCLLSDYADQKKLSEYWEKKTGDSKIVDIRKLQGQNIEEMSNAFVEVFKYALKFSDLDLDDNLMAYGVLKGKRLTGSTGLFWGVKVPEEDIEDLLEGLPFIEMLYVYRKRIGAYDLVETLDKGDGEVSGGFKYFRPK